MRVGNVFYGHVRKDWKWLLCQRMCLSGGKILQVIEIFNLSRLPIVFCLLVNLFTSLTLQKAEEGRLTVCITYLTKEGTNQMEKVYNNPVATFYLLSIGKSENCICLLSLFCGINVKTKFLC